MAHASNMALGSNQILVNWVDHKAIVTSNNPKRLPSMCEGGDPVGSSDQVIYYGNCTGDFWVEPPSGQNGKYEDTTGAWQGTATQIANNSAIPNMVHKTSLSLENGSLKISFPTSSARVSIMDVRGRSVFSQYATNSLSIPMKPLSRGTYIVSVVSQTQQWSQKIVVGQ